MKEALVYVFGAATIAAAGLAYTQYDRAEKWQAEYTETREAFDKFKAEQALERTMEDNRLTAEQKIAIRSEVNRPTW